ncbi:hypothetical protein Si018_01730 [Streptococcus infantarius subsp. infantarius]|nr:hypothetical protein [Streptococcus infantarius subsp. infantarius]
MKTNGVPKIRFKGFTDDWEERKLGELVTFSKGSGYSKGDLLKEGTPIILYGRLYTKYETVISNVDTFVEPKGKSVFSKGGEVIVPGSGETAEDISIASVVEESGVLLGGDLNIITPPKEINSAFLAISISNGKPHKDMAKMAQGKSVVHLHNSDLAKIDFPFPIYEEQCRISNQFAELDNLITLHQRKCEQTKELKKFMLQKMFPKKGEKNPEIRFPGFTDDWEERKLSSGLHEYTDRVIVEDDKGYYQISVRNNFGGITLRGSKMGNKIGRKRQAKINLTKYPQTLIFTRQTVEQGGIGWVEKYCDGAIVTENMPTISLDTSVFSKYFLTNLFQTKIFYKNAILDNIEGGSAQIAIHESKFLSSTLLFPNLDEQEKIGSFFKQIDETIILHQRKCEQLKELKKFMLQNMFPKKG